MSQKLSKDYCERTSAREEALLPEQFLSEVTSRIREGKKQIKQPKDQKVYLTV